MFLKYFLRSNVKPGVRVDFVLHGLEYKYYTWNYATVRSVIQTFNRFEIFSFRLQDEKQIHTSINNNYYDST